VTTLVGVIADTHISQRLRHLPDGIAAAFEGVRLILHCGDINRQSVLEELGRIAPVLAVAGNADPPWLGLPRQRLIVVDGCRIGLTHGHNGWSSYLTDKFRDRIGGWQQDRYLRYARQAFRGVDVIVTGHTHRPHLKYIGQVLLFNPGSIAPDYYGTGGPTVGLLRVESGLARAEVVPVGNGQHFGKRKTLFGFWRQRV
jgi:putative phosphoesterase